MTRGSDEEDYRVKNAREGKAHYIPGRSVEEVKAEIAAKAAVEKRQSSRAVALSAEDWAAVDTALPDTVQMLTDIRFLLHDMAFQEDLDQPWVNAALRITARAVEGMQGKELAAIERLDRAVRKAGMGEQA